MRRLFALLLACALFCFPGCGNAAEGDATQGAAGRGTESTQAESALSPEHQHTVTEKPGKDSHNPDIQSQQADDEQTLRTRAGAQECDTSVDVTAILPRFGVYENGSLSYGTRYAALICQCATVSGEMVWLYIGVEDYAAFFDPQANVTNCRFAYSDLAAFARPIRVSCATVASETLTQGLSEQVGEEVLLFGEAHMGVETDVVAVMYSGKLPAMTCVYTDAMTIEPVFLLANGCAAENTDVICRVTAANGSTVWVGMTLEAYNTWIDPEAELKDSNQAVLEKVTYQTPLRLYGVAVDAEVIAGGLSHSIGCTTAVCFVAVAEN